MHHKFCSIFFISALSLIVATTAYAQPQKGRFINASFGIGITFPYDDFDISGSGFYAQAEYVMGIKTWFGVRPYAGFIFTSPADSDNPNLADFKVSSKAFMVGGKVRVVAPIPWAAPFIEIGVGASIGTFETFTPLTNIDESGVFIHIPYSLGLALGPKHNVELAVTYYEHPSLEQVNGGVGITLSFPLIN